MATGDQIRALLESHVDQDDDRFLAIAMQVAAHAARRGQKRLAEDLREMVADAKRRRDRPTAEPVPIASPRGELAGLLSATYPRTRLSSMVLYPESAKRLERVLREERRQDELRAHALEPRRKLLLVGPPGSGKTMTAEALAGELHMPLFVVLLHGLITKYMGETAAKLGLVFEAMKTTPGVYLFDEFDALGVGRGSTQDVGEVRRVLTSFLQLMDHDTSGSLIIAATNDGAALDRALFRRFDDVLSYGLPGPDLVRRMMQDRLAAFDVDVDWNAATAAAEGQSFADVGRACDDAAKSSVLDGRPVTTASLVSALEERQQGR